MTITDAVLAVTAPATTDTLTIRAIDLVETHAFRACDDTLEQICAVARMCLTDQDDPLPLGGGLAISVRQARAHVAGVYAGLPEHLRRA